jgi:hypothetical protein
LIICGHADDRARDGISFNLARIYPYRRAWLPGTDHASKAPIPNQKQIEFRAHEAAERVLGRAHDWLTAYVETGVDQNRAFSQP